MIEKVQVELQDDCRVLKPVSPENLLVKLLDPVDARFIGNADLLAVSSLCKAELLQLHVGHTDFVKRNAIKVSLIPILVMDRRAALAEVSVARVKRYSLLVFAPCFCAEGLYISRILIKVGTGALFDRRAVR